MILLELDVTENDSIETEIQKNSLEAQILQKKNFNGQTEILEVLITITTISLPIISKIVIERIKAKKHIVVKHKGLTIKGLSEHNTLKVLEKIMGK